MTVIFLADVASVLPSPEEWPSVWADQSAWLKSKADYEATVNSRPSMFALRCVSGWLWFWGLASCKSAWQFVYADVCVTRSIFEFGLRFLCDVQLQRMGS